MLMSLVAQQKNKVKLEGQRRDLSGTPAACIISLKKMAVARSHVVCLATSYNSERF